MNFYNLLLAMGIGSCCLPTEEIQMFDELPVELVILILSYLDSKSLLLMSKTSRRLFRICKNTKVLRTTIRKHLRKERKDNLKKMLNPLKVRVLRSESENTAVVFQSQNTRRQTAVTRAFDPPHSISTMKRPVFPATSKKRSCDGKERNPGLTKRMRL